MFFVCTGLLIEHRKNPKAKRFLFISGITSIAYFIVITKFVIPVFSETGEYTGFQYFALGDSPLDFISTLVTEPINSIKVLFTNHINHTFGDYVKAEFHILVLISGLPLLFFKPQYLIMLIPLYFQKLFHDNYFMWGIGYQYSIEFAPILAIGVFSAISGFRSVRLKNTVSIIVTVLCISSSIRIMDNTIFYTDKTRIRIYDSKHYKRDYDVKKIHRLLSGIPKHSAVSAQSPYIPHLALREKIYHFPMLNDAEYIIYSEKEGKYPLNDDTFRETTYELESSAEWIIQHKDDDITILRRKAKELNL
jgi:uncharacterized membrane protein